MPTGEVTITTPVYRMLDHARYLRTKTVCAAYDELDEAIRVALDEIRAEHEVSKVLDIKFASAVTDDAPRAMALIVYRSEFPQDRFDVSSFFSNTERADR